MRVLVSLGAAAAALVMASPAAASIVTLDFAGNLNLPYFGSETGAISGTATYDTASDTHQEYQTGAVTSFSLTSPIFASLVGQSTLTQADLGGGFGDVHYVGDDAAAGFDQFEVTFYFTNFPHPQINFDLVFPTGSIATGGRLPTSLPPLSDATIYKGVRLDDYYGDLTLGTITRFDMTSTSDSTSAAPEPASWALAILGFAGAGAALRRRRALAGA